MVQRQLDIARQPLNVARARLRGPHPLCDCLGLIELTAAQQGRIHAATTALIRAGDQTDDVLRAEDLRAAMRALDRITGAADTEAMLDTLFGRFCIGK